MKFGVRCFEERAARTVSCGRLGWLFVARKKLCNAKVDERVITVFQQALHEGDFLNVSISLSLSISLWWLRQC